MRFIGVSNLLYFLANFLSHLILFLIFAIYVSIRIIIWETTMKGDTDDYDINWYIIPRFVVGFSIIPLVYLAGYGMRNVKNVWNISATFLYLICWLSYNAFVTISRELYSTICN